MRLMLNLLLLTTLFTACAPSPPAPTPPPPFPIEKAGEGPYQYQIMTMANGMQVITLEDHSCPVAAIQLWYRVGSVDEEPDRRGFAHMFEHMMFRGTDNLDSEGHFKYIKAAGGSCNAYTSFDHTVYINEVPANQLEMAFWLESERMAFLKINEHNFNTEREVVKEEYQMGQEQPYGTLIEKVLPAIFNDGAYSWSPIGNMEELQAAAAAELQAFWETYYTPNNAVLVVTGDISHSTAQILAQKYFGWIPRYPAPPEIRVKQTEKNKQAIQLEFKEKNGPAPITALLYRTVPAGHPDALPLSLLSTILGGGESSRLNRRLVQKEQLAVTAFAMDYGLKQDGIWAMAAILNPVKTLNPFAKAESKSLQAMREELFDIMLKGPSAAEMETARNRALRRAVAGQTTVSGKASILGQAFVTENDIAAVNTQFDRIRAIAAEDIKRVARQYMKIKHEIEIQVKPGVGGLLNTVASAGKAKTGAARDRGKPSESVSDGPSGKPGLERPGFFGKTPPLTELKQPDLRADAQTFTLESGLNVRIISNHEIPLVRYKLGLRAGAFTDPTDAPGTAAMAAAMLTRGTAAHSYEALAQELDRLAINAGGYVGMDSGAVNASAVTDQADKALGYLAEIVMSPSFPDDQLAILKSQTQTSKIISEKSPMFIANRELRRRLFPEHPYAREADGELRDLPRITTEGMRDWWQTYVRPDTCVLYMAGDITPERARALARKHFGAWKAEGETPALRVPAPPEAQPTRIYLVDKPGDQAQIRVGSLGITQHDPRYFAARVLNQVFGGGFSSRLNRAVRVNKGLTYGARGGWTAERFAGRFTASTFSRNKTAAEALQVVLDEIRNLTANPPTEEETGPARDYLLGSFVLKRETVNATVNDLWNIELEGLAPDFLTRYIKSIHATKAKHLRRLARELVMPDRLVIVVVGPAAELKDGLARIAPVTLVRP